MDSKFKEMTKKELMQYIKDHPEERLNLSGATLSGADLSGATLSGADLSWADLSWAILSGADLSWATLSGADLSEATLSGATLSEADLSWATLSGAAIDDFRFEAKGLTEETVKHLMALDFVFLGKDAERIVKDAIESNECPFDNFRPLFYHLAGPYWERGLKGYFTTDLSFPEIWEKVVKDLKAARGEA